MTENEVKEVVKDLRSKAEVFRNSGCAVDGIVKDYENTANTIEKLSEDIQSYRAIGTVEEFKALKEKNVAKKPKMIGYREDGEPVYECGCCGSTLKVADQPFCMICSCKVDWQ